MKFTSLLRHLAAVAGTALAASPLLASAPTPQTANSSEPTTTSVDLGSLHVKIGQITNSPTSKPAHSSGSNSAPLDLEIRNGSIVENDKPIEPAYIGTIIEYVRKTNPNVNIALGPGVGAVEIKDLILHMPQANFVTLFNALQTSSGGAIDYEYDSSENLHSVVLAQSQKRDVAVFNLKSYVDPNGNANPDDVQKSLGEVRNIILETSDRMNIPGPQLEFHPGADLLIVIGTNKAIDIAGQVVNGLNQPAKSIPSVAEAWAHTSPSSLNPAEQVQKQEEQYRQKQLLEILQTWANADSQASNSKSGDSTDAKSRDALLQAIVAAWATQYPQNDDMARNPTQMRIEDMAKVLSQVDQANRATQPTVPSTPGSSSGSSGSTPTTNSQ